MECPQLRHGQCVLACAPRAKLKEKKKVGKQIIIRSCVGIILNTKDGLPVFLGGREGREGGEMSSTCVTGICSIGL